MLALRMYSGIPKTYGIALLFGFAGSSPLLVNARGVRVYEARPCYRCDVLLVPLSQGRFALVDDADADLLAFKWYASKGHRTWYARRNVPASDGEQTTVRLHRVIADRMGVAGDIDHRDRHGLNCTRGNLRAATDQQNAANRPLRSDNTSGVKGVHWCKRREKWHAHIRVAGRNRHLGYFVDLSAAADAARSAREQAFGEFACHI